MNKYGAHKTEVDNVVFDSKAESYHYKELKLRLSAGEIKDLQLQPAYVLQSGFKRAGISYRPIIYVGDFRFTEVKTGKVVIEDVKSPATRKIASYLLKKKLLLHDLPEEIEFREVV